jgi:hypothetical protein
MSFHLNETVCFDRTIQKKKELIRQLVVVTVHHLLLFFARKTTQVATFQGYLILHLSTKPNKPCTNMMA